MSNTSDTTYTKVDTKKFVSTNNTTFGQQNVQLKNSPLFFPAGYEIIFLILYIVLLPYFTGLLFVFIYVTKGDPSVFGSLSSDMSFILNWCIGYECLAAIALLMILKSAIQFHFKNREEEKKTFKRP